MSRWFYDGPVRERARCSSWAFHANLETSRALSRSVSFFFGFFSELFIISRSETTKKHTAFTKPVSTSLSDEPNTSKTRSLCNDKHCIDIWHSVSTINRLRFTNNLSRYFVDTLKRLNWTCRLPGYHDLPLLCRFLTTNHADGKRARWKLRQMTR